MDNAREQLRCVHEDLLKQVEKIDAQELRKKTHCGDQWMLLAAAKEIDKMNSVGSKKEGKRYERKKETSRKSKKTKNVDRKRHRYLSRGSNDSSEEERIAKKTRKKRNQPNHSGKESKLSSENESSGEWVEKKIVEDKSKSESTDWMRGMTIPTYSKNTEEARSLENKNERKNIDSYNPSTSVRELNPYWRDGGKGLPTFRKPLKDSADDNDDMSSEGRHISPDRGISLRQSSWRKQSESKGSSTHQENRASSASKSSSPSSLHCAKDLQCETSRGDFLTDQQMNELGAKILKAEIVGNDEIVEELRMKLERARQYRTKHEEEFLSTSFRRRNLDVDKNNLPDGEEEILLTFMNKEGMHWPIENSHDDGESSQKVKRRKVETHSAGNRVRYYADDDKYDIKQMFEKEKFTSRAEHDKEFVNIAGKLKNPHVDLEDLFDENVCKQVDKSCLERKNRERAIMEHQKLARSLDACDKCFDSPNMAKQRVVAIGTNVYLSLPWHEGLSTGHCIIAPLKHEACVTHLDEDVWAEMREFMKAVVRMFSARKMDVVFFESARNIHCRPHLQVHCVPGNFEMAPFYFKKAIQEAEGEWTTNKQLLHLSERDVRRVVPKGLPYFWVNFGMQSGFAHVIENQEKFSNTFAQEVIGGLLNLDPRFWRRPRKVANLIQKIKQFADWWKPFDFTK